MPPYLKLEPINKDSIRFETEKNQQKTILAETIPNQI